MFVKKHGKKFDYIVKYHVECNCFIFTLALIVVECSSGDLILTSVYICIILLPFSYVRPPRILS
jgi:hypothetical protein